MSAPSEMRSAGAIAAIALNPTYRSLMIARMPTIAWGRATAARVGQLRARSNRNRLTTDRAAASTGPGEFSHGQSQGMRRSLLPRRSREDSSQKYYSAGYSQNF